MPFFDQQPFVDPEDLLALRPAQQQDGRHERGHKINVVGQQPERSVRRHGGQRGCRAFEQQAVRQLYGDGHFSGIAHVTRSRSSRPPIM